MDSATLFTQLQTALSAVLTDEAQLQAALTAVQNTLPPTTVDPNDAVVSSMVGVLVDAGLVTVASPAPVTPTDGTTTTDTSQDGQVAANTPSQPDQAAPAA